MSGLETLIARAEAQLGKAGVRATDRSSWDWYAEDCPCGQPPGISLLSASMKKGTTLVGPPGNIDFDNALRSRQNQRFRSGSLSGMNRPWRSGSRAKPITVT